MKPRLFPLLKNRANGRLLGLHYHSLISEVNAERISGGQEGSFPGTIPQALGSVFNSIVIVVQLWAFGFCCCRCLFLREKERGCAQALVGRGEGEREYISRVHAQRRA